ncbi:MAG TPA: hypothetical protein VNK96_06960 [Fimbriimonadales bacterium]|nr:hypothetical protein [Fimbriimonadales bacterium]
MQHMKIAYRNHLLHVLPFALSFTLTSLCFAQAVEVETKFTSGKSLARAVLDTRTIPQFSDFHMNMLMAPPENPLIWKKSVNNVPPSNIVPGGMLSDPRARLEGLWPGIQMDGWYPPDLTLAVGPDYIVATVNMKIAFFKKSDGTKVFEVWLGNQATNGFFKSVGALDFTFDPRCLYDKNTGRFFVMCAEVYSSTAFLDIAVSDDSDPNGVWYLYRTNAKTGNSWVDYPGLGINSEALFVTGNLFGFSSGFNGVLFRAYNLSELLSGAATVTYKDIVKSSGTWSVQPAESKSPTNIEYFAQDGSTSSMKIHAMVNATTSPVLYTTTVSVPSFSYPNSSAPQKGTTADLDVLDGRVFNTWYQNGRLLTSHAVRKNSSTSYTVGRWYDFNLGDWPNSGTVTLVQSGNVEAGSGIYVFFPAVAFNDFMDIGMVVARSSANEYPSVWATGRKSTDPSGTMGSLIELKTGATYWNGYRWGDYFGIQVDPSDGLTFWGVGEYADSPSAWKSWIASWKVAEYRKLTVEAKLRDGTQLNIPIQCTTDGYGNGDGTTPFTRTYYDGTNVTLTAPSSYGGYKFLGWKGTLGPAVGTPNPNFNVTMNADKTVTALYR